MTRNNKRKRGDGRERVIDARNLPKDASTETTIEGHQSYMQKDLNTIHDDHHLKQLEKKEKRRKKDEGEKSDKGIGLLTQEAGDVAGDSSSAVTKHTKPTSPDREEDISKAEGGQEEDQSTVTSQPLKPKSARKILKNVQQLPPVEDPDISTAHLSVLSKFKQYQALAAELTEEPAQDKDDAEEIEVVIAEGLEPLPQPAPVILPKHDPLSSLPLYLAKPTLVSTSNRVNFNTFDISSRLQSKLSNLSFIEAFPVQAAIIPLLLAKPTRSNPAEDLLVSASTGSGKTLSYLIPIIESLRTRVVTRVRALIIVPTRELVTQVQSTAESLAAGSSLKIGTAIGTRAYSTEVEQLVGRHNGAIGVDILIVTPGRLVEHLRNTKGFTLEYLKWLVVDEADRLLGQSFQEWVDIVMAELEKPRLNNEGNTMSINGTAVDLANFGLRVPENALESVRKVILSATMTRDVGKLAGLKLRRPRLIVVDETVLPNRHDDMMIIENNEAKDGDMNTELPEIHSLPSKLSEFYLAVSSTSKPLLLHKLLKSKNMTKGILIFTKSNESAARLGRLLELISPANSKLQVAVCSGEMRKKEAGHNVSKFKKDEIAILICTDLISRGMDISTASHVINYDTPRSMRDYIHRVGRTARAGKHGEAWNLVEENEARWWWKAIGKGIKRKEDVKREKVEDITENEEKIYQKALEELGREVRKQ